MRITTDFLAYEMLELLRLDYFLDDFRTVSFADISITVDEIDGTPVALSFKGDVETVLTDCQEAIHIFLAVCVLKKVHYSKISTKYA